MIHRNLGVRRPRRAFDTHAAHRCGTAGRVPASIQLLDGLAPAPASLSLTMDLGRPHAKGIRDLEDVGKAGIPLASLDPAEVGAIQSRVQGQLLLGEPTLLPALPDCGTEGGVSGGPRWRLPTLASYGLLALGTPRPARSSMGSGTASSSCDNSPAMAGNWTSHRSVYDPGGPRCCTYTGSAEPAQAANPAAGTARTQQLAQGNVKCD